MKDLIYSPLFFIGGYGALWLYRNHPGVLIGICLFLMVPVFLYRLIQGHWFDYTDYDE